MSRFFFKSVPKNGTNNRDGTRARIRESGHCPVPFPVPFCPWPVPFRFPLHLLRLRSIALARWVMAYESEEGKGVAC
jgi:hypothetical protein